jgi:hypothetical protein
MTIERRLTGLTVTGVRNLNQRELDKLGWEPRRGAMLAAIVFNDGTIVFASMDPEGNGPGCLFGQDSDGENAFYVEAE